MRFKNLIPSLVFSTIFFFTVQNASAQFPGMKQFRTNMDYQFMQQQMQMQMNAYFHGFSRSQYSSCIVGASNEYTYLVKMKDGSKKTVKSYIYIDTTLHKSYLLFIDKSFAKSDSAHRKQKIYTDKTLSIGRIYNTLDSSENTVTVYFTGTATDSCWLFKALPGKISLYSFVSEFGNSHIFDASTIVAIQYDNGPIVHLDPDELKHFIAADEKAMKFFDKKYYFDAVKRYNKDIEKASDN